VHLRATTFAAITALLVGCSGIRPGAKLEFTPTFSPVKFSVDSNGHFSMEAAKSISFVLPLGKVELTADLSHDLQPTSGGLRVAIADRAGDGAQQQIYEVGFRGTVGFCAEGRVFTTVQQGLVRVRPGNDTTVIWMVDRIANEATCNRASSFAAPATVEYVTNGGFESELTGWENCHEVSPANMKTSDHDNTHSGVRKLPHYADNPYEQLTCQIIKLPNGHYKFSGWARSSGGQSDLWFYAKGYNDGSTEVQARIGSAPVDEWTRYTINDIPVTNSTVEVGVWSRTPGNTWAVFDDLSLTRK
jgi:hypothetical protein